MENLEQSIYYVAILIGFGLLYLRLLWWTARINRIRRLANKFDLTFSTGLPYFLGLYWFLWPQQINKIVGIINGHQVEISDNFLWFRFKRARETKILIDNQRLGLNLTPKNLSLRYATVGSINFLARISELEEILNSLRSGDIPDLVPNKRVYWLNQVVLPIIIIGVMVGIFVLLLYILSR